jgi:DNA-binding GntR family transcriptional regulator
MTDIKSKKDSLAEAALIKIQEAVASGDLLPNQHLVEAQLSRKFGMSRTPVREAIRRLQQMGHVTILPNGRAIVTEFSPKHIKDQFEIREALESVVVKLDCERATEEQISRARIYLDQAAEAAARHDLGQLNRFKGLFHDVLLEACENDRLISMIKTIRDYYYIGRLARIMTEAEIRRNIKQHYVLIDSLSQRNKTGAQKALREMIRTNAKITLGFS